VLNGARSIVTAVNPMACIVDEFAPSIRAREAFAESIAFYFRA